MLPGACVSLARGTRKLRSSDQDAQFAGTLEQRLQSCRALDDDVRGQLHLRYAVAIARLQRGALGWAESGGGHALPSQSARSGGPAACPMHSIIGHVQAE